MFKQYIKIAFVAFLGFAFTGCSEEDLSPESVFPETSDTLDPTSASYQLDKFLEDNYLKVYNLQFRYKLQDVGADMNYNLVPATYENAVDMAVLAKYLWFDVYKKCVDPDFLKQYGPRIIHLIGSPAYNPYNGTMILGLAEGGLKVSLFRMNLMDINDFNQLNEMYFKTMHHEFAHILHQTKTYPNEFNLISTQHYDPMGWQEKDERVSNSLGFASSYGSSQTREDFAEIIANYITKTDAQWNQILEDASCGWKQVYDDKTGLPQLDANGKYVYEKAEEDTDGVDGRAVILQKVEIARQWFKEAWDMDLDALRAEVQARQTNYDINDLRQEVYGITVGK